jgi:hypothetical protein
MDDVSCGLERPVLISIEVQDHAHLLECGRYQNRVDRFANLEAGRYPLEARQVCGFVSRVCSDDAAHRASVHCSGPGVHAHTAFHAFTLFRLVAFVWF